jgi:hypothetical protein
MLHIALFPLYWIAVTPAGWIMRLIHDPLHRQWDPEAETYLTVPASRKAVRKRRQGRLEVRNESSS